MRSAVKTGVTRVPKSLLAIMIGKINTIGMLYSYLGTLNLTTDDLRNPYLNRVLYLGKIPEILNLITILSNASRIEKVLQTSGISNMDPRRSYAGLNLTRLGDEDCV